MSDYETNEVEMKGSNGGLILIAGLVLGALGMKVADKIKAKKQQNELTDDNYDEVCDSDYEDIDDEE